MISIIVPFNNGKKYLDKCLKNLSEIQYEDFEIILIDDYSQDNSEKIAKKNKKTKYYYTTEKTIGVGNARNLGLEKANGKYIMFVDVDDTIDVDLLKNLQQYIDKDIDMIKYKMKIIKDGKNIETKGPVFNVTDGQDGFNKLCFNDKFLDSPCLYLIKKDLFNKTDLKFEKNLYHEDFGLIPQLLVNASSIISTSYYGYNYFQSDNSIMRNNDYSKKIEKVNDKFIHYNNLLKNLEKYKLTKCTKQNLMAYYINSIILAVKDLQEYDRRLFEEKIKDLHLVKNIKANNIKQLFKKIILMNNLELYYKIYNYM